MVVFYSLALECSDPQALSQTVTHSVTVIDPLMSKLLVLVAFPDDQWADSAHSQQLLYSISSNSVSGTALRLSDWDCSQWHSSPLVAPLPRHGISLKLQHPQSYSAKISGAASASSTMFLALSCPSLVLTVVLANDPATRVITRRVVIVFLIQFISLK